MVVVTVVVAVVVVKEAVEKKSISNDSSSVGGSSITATTIAAGTAIIQERIGATIRAPKQWGGGQAFARADAQINTIGVCIAKVVSCCIDSVSERLRRWTRNPLGSARRGSNPLAVELFVMHRKSQAKPMQTGIATRAGAGKQKGGGRGEPLSCAAVAGRLLGGFPQLGLRPTEGEVGLCPPPSGVVSGLPERLLRPQSCDSSVGGASD